MATNVMPVKFGLQLWSQQTDWPGFRDAALAAEANGWDSVWTWDHLLAIFGPWEQPIFEGWGALAALGPITERVRLGLMVGANTFRNPGVTTKLATTLDHVSGGRAVLGIGAAWFEREHEAFGIPSGRSPGERIGWLEESVDAHAPAARRRARGPRRADVRHARRALRAATRPGTPADPDRGQRASEDAADGGRVRPTAGTPRARSSDVQDALATLQRHCAEIGRDIATIEKTVSFPIVLRDDAGSRRYEDP